MTPSTGSQVLVERTARNAARADAAEIRAFAKCRNEHVRLPAFLDHYRSIGVDRFFVVDNDSSDGSFEYLAAQADVQLFRTANSFREAHGGVDWLNALLAEFGVGGWCVTVDIDELLMYPGSETTSLPRLTAYLDERGLDAFACMLLDVYPSEPLGERTFATAGDLIAASPFFDQGPYDRAPIDMCPGVLMRGGVRERVFYPEYQSRGAATKLYEAIRSRILRRFPDYQHRRWLPAVPTPPLLTKVPLVKWDENTRFLGPHWITRKVTAGDSGVLLHFKFLEGFYQRAVQEVERAEYYQNASEYRRYVERLGDAPRQSFMFDGSTRFRGTAQLVSLGLMRETAEWSSARTNPIR